MSSPKKESDNPTNSNNDDQIRRDQLQMQFRSIRREDFQTVKAYVKKLKATADSLTAIGNPVSDRDLFVQLLAGLPSPQYLLIKNTISSQLPRPNFSEACSKLYEYEKKTTSGGAGESSNSSNSNSSKSTMEMIHDIASTVLTVAPIARELWNALPTWSGGSSSGTGPKPKPKASTPGHKENGGTGGRGNNNGGRGGGRSTGGRGNNNGGRGGGRSTGGRGNNNRGRGGRGGRNFA